MGFKILNFNIFGGFQKNEYFLGMMILWIFFWGHHKIGLVFGSFLCILCFFLKVEVQNGDIFWGCLNFKYFRVLDIPDIIWGV